MAKEPTQADQARREEVKRKAQELARAAGKDWRQLSKEERREYRKQVRKGK